MTDSTATAQQGDFIDDCVDWLKALLIGDWDEDAPTSTVVINGLLGLIPVIDQLLDVRDVAGVLFRINRNGGIAKASRDDKLSLALAALGCIPEFGSAMKTSLKVLWKERKVGGKFIQGGVELLERMRGMQKGAAITWAKTLQWGQLAQQAAAKVDLALASMVAVLTWLSVERWWVPDSLEGLARDLLPQIKAMQGQYNQAVTEGIYAVRDFMNELLGEDAAVLVTAMAQQSPSHHAGTRARAGQRTPNKHKQTTADGKRPANKTTDEHPSVQNKRAQNTNKGNTGTPSATTAMTQAALKAVTKQFRALLGEHMADYHHMKTVGGSWPHGQVKDSKPKPTWSSTAKLVEEKSPQTESSPTELVMEHIKRPNEKGVDGVWSLGGGTYHFVEAKCYESPGSIVFWGDKSTRPYTNKKGKENPATRFEPPPHLTERQLALWYMLGQPKTMGLQMSRNWLESTAHRSMLGPENIDNRVVYLFLIIPGRFKPIKGYALKADNSAVDGKMAGGMLDHGNALTLAVSAKEGLHDKAVYTVHEPTHEWSDTFSYQEIDFLDNEYKDMRNRSTKVSQSGNQDSSKTEQQQKPVKRTRKRNK